MSLHKNSKKTEKIFFTSENIEEVISELFSVLKYSNESEIDLDLKNYSFVLLNDWKKCQRIVKIRMVYENVRGLTSIIPTRNPRVTAHRSLSDKAYPAHFGFADREKNQL